MKGRTRTSDERQYHDEMAKLGCIACRLDGVANSFVVIHHIDGRTKKNAHMEVLPLCSNHHQHDDTDPAGRIGVHPWKARFEKRYGGQYQLLAMCNNLIEDF